jgi:two-component system, OmpR family, phosphate regulon response regulator PhoB
MANKTVLIVEDEKPLLNAIRTKLENSGFDVLTSRTVEQALNYMNDIPNIDAIWLDHYLIGKGTGLDFVVAIKNEKRWKKIPIFVVSNTASPEKVHSYIKFGVSKYYTKADFRLDQIIADMKAVLK